MALMFSILIDIVLFTVIMAIILIGTCYLFIEYETERQKRKPMSNGCNECYGTYPNCPCCGGSDEDEIYCSECGGVGELYYNEDGIRITISEYIKLPQDERVCEPCEFCAK